MGFPSCVLRTYDKNVFYFTQSLGVLQIYDKNVFLFFFKFILSKYNCFLMTET
jgi:hypothetical protein